MKAILAFLSFVVGSIILTGLSSATLWREMSDNKGVKHSRSVQVMQWDLWINGREKHDQKLLKELEREVAEANQASAKI